ncbi:TadE family type IV pilus minor pilin [Pseudarthrobacter sp. P1]|uniref:TadE family type IV pilus minor pilin n=1 Tax=Pseudarthrobacter sp. P1 TaxID=3418418 RepID=UPI003CF5C228
MIHSAAVPVREAAAQRGSVTAELAVTLPAVILLLALLLLGGSAGVLQLRLEESARAAARAMARGETTAASAGIATSIAGAGAAVSIGADGGIARVTVEARMSGALAALVPWPLAATATARLESDGAEAAHARAKAGRPNPLGRYSATAVAAAGIAP